MMKLTSNTLSIKPQFVFVVLVSLWLGGCSPTTQITGTWKNPEAMSQRYSKIIVVALTDNVRARQTVETDMQAQLQQKGVQSTRSIDMMQPTVGQKGGPDVNMILAKVEEQGYDGILTIALLDKETDSRYVPGTYNYAPMTSYGYYGRFRGYYSYWSPTVYDPGYYTEDNTYYLETNLYDVKSEHLQWSAQTKSYSPSSLTKESAKLAELTVAKMVEEGLVQ